MIVVIYDMGQKQTNAAVQRRKHGEQDPDADKSGLEAFVFNVNLV